MPRTAKSRGLTPGISRIDQEATRTHGYFVRIGYERGTGGGWRPRHRAFFGDKSFGGKKGALKAAEAWKAEVAAAESKSRRGGTKRKS